jgi:hypothetical protein
MYSIQNGGLESPIAAVVRLPVTPVLDRRHNLEPTQRSAMKRRISYASPPTQVKTMTSQSTAQKQHAHDTVEHKEKIAFPPFVLTFKSEQRA